MKRKHYILGTLALLCLLGTGYYVWTLYDAHRKQVVEWNEGAKAAFEEALWVEVNKRAEVPFYHSSGREQGVTTLKERIPDSVYVTTAMGRKAYWVERFKYENSLIKEREKRIRIGALLLEYPLSWKIVKANWDSLLLERQIVSQNQVRYVYTDLELQNDTIEIRERGEQMSFDSLTVKYLGFRCEHEVTAYISYPYWMSCIAVGQWVILLFPWLLLLLLELTYSKLKVLLQCLFVHKEIIIQEKTVEKEVIVEKSIHLADVQIDEAEVFKLPDGSLFDSFSGTLTKGGLSKQIPPQSSILLILFLRKETHRLSVSEIEKELWNGQGNTNQLHKAIQRLRADLRRISSDVVIKNVNGNYELKLPFSSSKLNEIGTNRI